MRTIRIAILFLTALPAFVTCSAFSAQLSEKQQAAIRQEVVQTLHGMLAAEERLDAAAV